MPPISQLLQSNVNRLVLANVVIYFLVEAFYAGASSGFELYYYDNPEFGVWQLITSMFLHGSVSHLAFNMLALWSFGRILERVWGNQRFLFFYIVCGIAAGVIHELVTQFQFQAAYAELLSGGISSSQLDSVLLAGRDISGGYPAVSKQMLIDFYSLYHSPAVGASGAIYGVLVAFTMLFPNFKVMLIFLPVPIAAKYFVPVLLLIDLTAGITGFSIFGANIAHFAHIGGAIAGFVLVMYWMKQSSR